MRAVTLVTSSLYSLLQICGGLFLHPYQTMQHIVEEKVFAWLTFLPSVLAVLAAGIWWVCLETFFLQLPYIGMWAFILLWLMTYFFFWQVLLLYLLIRFWITLR